MSDMQAHEQAGVCMTCFRWIGKPADHAWPCRGGG